MSESTETSVAAFRELPDLTAEQRAIVEDRSNHMMIEAGAGSGKTTLIIAKTLDEMGIESLTSSPPEQPLDLQEIGAITFTRKAAGELKERLRAQFLRQAEKASGQLREHWTERAFSVDEARIGTIDAFAGRMIRDYGGLAGLETGFEILDPGEAQALHREVAEEEILAGIDAENPGAMFLVRQFGFLRARQIMVDAFDQADLLREIQSRRQAGLIDWDRYQFDLTAADVLLEPHADQALSFVLDAYEGLVQRMEEDGTYDHTHVVLKAARLAEHPEVQQTFQQELDLLFVDEHQDTSRAQAALLFRLAGLPDPTDLSRAQPDQALEEAETPPLRLVMVGDPKQSIYGFRNADIRLWGKSKNVLDQIGGQYYTLTDNHRSRPTLIRFFDNCLGRILGETYTETGQTKEGDPSRSRYEVPYRSLQPSRPETPGDGVELLLAGDTSTEQVAEVMAERIADMLENPEQFPVWEQNEDGEPVKRPVQPQDIAILSPTLKDCADEIERALQDRGLRSYIYGGRGLYGRQEIQDLAILLRAVADPYDPFALTAFLRSPLGGVDDEVITALSQHSTGAQQKEAEAASALYEALRRSQQLLEDFDEPARRRAREAFELIEKLRELRDRKPHHELLEMAIEESGYRAFLAGAPDRPAGLRNIEKLLRVAQQSSREPLFSFVRKLEARVSRVDPMEEAPLYSPGDEGLITVSTIHKAKGLEWPYVFVANLQKRLFWKVRSSEPHLTSDFGLTLPLDIVVREEEANVPSSEESAVWKRFVRDETYKEYAEAKRLFYVACTRARDRIFLAGALQKDSKPRSLSNSVDYLSYQGADHWLRHLYPPITKTGEPGRSFRYGSGEPATTESGQLVGQDDQARIRRGLEEMREVGDASEGKGKLAQDRPREWPKAVLPEDLGEVPTVEMPAVLAQRLGGTAQEAILREEFSASELLKYDACDWKHFYGYRRGLSEPALETQGEEAKINLVLPRKRGDILHDYLLDHQHEWSEQKRLEEMQRVVLRHIPMGEDQAVKSAKEILEHARHYFESDWYQRAQEAEESYREIPFVYQMAPDVRVRGKIDFLFKEEDGWRIVDFKAGLFRGSDVEDQIRARKEQYRVQASLYTLATQEALGDRSVQEFAFFFTDPGQAGVFEVSSDWPAQAQQHLIEVARKARRGEYSDVPEYGKKKCRGCQYYKICKPEGRPEEPAEKQEKRVLPVVQEA